MNQNAKDQAKRGDNRRTHHVAFRVVGLDCEHQRNKQKQQDMNSHRNPHPSSGTCAPTNFVRHSAYPSRGPCLVSLYLHFTFRQNSNQSKQKLETPFKLHLSMSQSVLTNIQRIIRSVLLKFWSEIKLIFNCLDTCQLIMPFIMPASRIRHKCWG